VKTSVVVPTFKRVSDLERCLAALARQDRPADEVIVIARADDVATTAALDCWLSGGLLPMLSVSLVTASGVVAAYNRGLECATGDIVCFTDDDAAPHPDWLHRIVLHFVADPAAGGVGGRDHVHERGAILDGAALRVGLVSWYGRNVGNHHIGAGAARRVDVLKGVSMAWRRSAIEGLRFDLRLRGTGAQVHCELGFSLSVGQRGWKLVYDPLIRVEHYPAPRADEDQRHSFNEGAFSNASFNLRLIMLEHLSPLGRLAFPVYGVLLGNRADPGLVRALMLALGPEGFGLAFKKWLLGVRAMRSAWVDAARHASRKTNESRKRGASSAPTGYGK
jgi:glycosyltransferase involved in cell wall biosynthesis